jgi:hypothetical protein
LAVLVTGLLVTGLLATGLLITGSTVGLLATTSVSLVSLTGTTKASGLS